MVMVLSVSAIFLGKEDKPIKTQFHATSFYSPKREWKTDPLGMKKAIDDVYLGSLGKALGYTKQ